MSYNENLIILFELEDGFSPADLLTIFCRMNSGCTVIFRSCAYQA